jgi:uncharacterized protein
MPPFELAAATLGSLLAGFVNAIAGGGGLVSLPILFAIFPSAPPATLFGTNKGAMVWGTAWSASSFARHVKLPWPTLVPAIGAATCGGLLGAWCVTLVSPEWLRRLVPIMLAVVLVYTIVSRDIGQVHAPRYRPRAEALVASLIAGGLGFYDGFFGPGTGSFFIFLLVRLLGFDFLHAVASAKVLNMTTNLASLVIFAATGNVWWPFVLPMAVANIMGSHLGTRLALRHGSRLIRLVFILVVAGLILKTALDAS